MCFFLPWDFLKRLLSTSSRFYHGAAETVSGVGCIAAIAPAGKRGAGERAGPAASLRI